MGLDALAPNPLDPVKITTTEVDHIDMSCESQGPGKLLISFNTTCCGSCAFFGLGWFYWWLHRADPPQHSIPLQKVFLVRVTWSFNRKTTKPTKKEGTLHVWNLCRACIHPKPPHPKIMSHCIYIYNIIL